jgi:hypothetical protein
MEKIRHAHFLRQIDKAEGAIREFGMALEGEPLLTPKEHRQLTDQWKSALLDDPLDLRLLAARIQAGLPLVHLMAQQPRSRPPKHGQYAADAIPQSEPVDEEYCSGYDGSRRARHGMDGPA